MVAIKSHEADRFIADLPTHIFLYLVFGTDAGLVSERKRGLLRKVVSDPSDVFQITQISGDAIAADPLRLLDEANAVSLFGGKRAISIEAGAKSFVGTLESLLKAPPHDCTIVISGGALKRDSALRNLLERDRAAASIECFPDGQRELNDMIQAMAVAAGQTIQADARRLLSEMLGSDRLASRGEIEKLLLYTHGRGPVSVEDVDASVADQSVLAVETAVSGAFSGDKATVDDTASRAFTTGGDANMLLAFVMRHAISLHRARLEIDAGGGIDQAIQGLLRGGTLTRKEVVTRQLRIWTASRLIQTIARITDAVGTARREPRLAEISAVRTLWAIAHLANPGNN